MKRIATVGRRLALAAALAGGAFLQWLEGTPLPGLVALEAA